VSGDEEWATRPYTAEQLQTVGVERRGPDRRGGWSWFGAGAVAAAAVAAVIAVIVASSSPPRAAPVRASVVAVSASVSTVTATVVSTLLSVAPAPPGVTVTAAAQLVTKTLPAVTTAVTVQKAVAVVPPPRVAAVPGGLSVTTTLAGQGHGSSFVLVVSCAGAPAQRLPVPPGKSVRVVRAKVGACTLWVEASAATTAARSPTVTAAIR